MPIGSVTSQLFSNVYLDAFDHFIKEVFRVRYYIRYTDDFVIVHQDLNYLQSLVPLIKRWLWQHRKLMIHPRKVTIRKVLQGIDFLGWVHFSDHRVLRTVTKRRMLKRIWRHPAKAALQSYLGLLRHGNTHRLRQQIVKHLTV